MRVPWHIFLLLIGLVLLLLAGLIGSGMGLVGPAAQSFVLEQWQILRTFYVQLEKEIDGAIKIGGFVASVIGGLTTIGMSYIYADRNLPHRLQSYLQRSNEKIIIDRSKIVAAWEADNARNVRAGFGSTATFKLARNSAKDVQEYSQALKISALENARLRKKTADAYLLSGLDHVAKAGAAMAAGASTDRIQSSMADRKAAVIAFKNATEHDESIHQAARFASDQYIELHEFDDAMAQAKIWYARTAFLPVENARARLHMCRIIMNQSEDPSLPLGRRNLLRREAQQRSEALAEHVQSDSGFNGRPEKPELVGSILEFAGDVRAMRENRLRATQRYQAAIASYRLINASSRIAEVENKLAELEPAN